MVNTKINNNKQLQQQQTEQSTDQEQQQQQQQQLTEKHGAVAATKRNSTTTTTVKQQQQQTNNRTTKQKRAASATIKNHNNNEEPPNILSSAANQQQVNNRNNNSNSNSNQNSNSNNSKSQQQQQQQQQQLARSSLSTTNDTNNNNAKTKNLNQNSQQRNSSYRNSNNTYAQTLGAAASSHSTRNTNNNRSNNGNNGKTRGTKVFTNSSNHNISTINNYTNNKQQQQQQTGTVIKNERQQKEQSTAAESNANANANASNNNNKNNIKMESAGNEAETTPITTTTTTQAILTKFNASDILTAVQCAKCSLKTPLLSNAGNLVNNNNVSDSTAPSADENTASTKTAMTTTIYSYYEPIMYTNHQQQHNNGSNNSNSNNNTSSSNSGQKQYRKSKSYVGSSARGAGSDSNKRDYNYHNNNNNSNGRYHHYNRSLSDRRTSFDRNFAERNKDFVPIAQPLRPILSSSNIGAVIADADKLIIIERLGKGRISYPIMQSGTLDAPISSYHQQRSIRMDAYQIDDGFHSDGGTETPPPSPSSGSSIASTSDHGSLESVDTGGTQRLAVLSFEQVRKLHNVMDEKVAIHGRGNFPTLEVTLKDLVTSVRRKLEADVASGGAGVIVKDIRLNGGAASHVLAPEDQPYNDLDLIYAIELTSPRHFDRVKTAVLNTLLDLLPEGVSKRRIMPCALKEAYVGKMVKVNNNNDGDRWSLISLGNSPGHKNVELKFVDSMRRQFEFSVDSFQIVLDSLLLFYDCAALPISENFYPTVVGESVYGDFQEALYHLQKKLISTRQPEEIRGGGLLKYCNLLVRNYKPVDPQRIKTLERYMCSRFFIDFPDINIQTVKLEAYLRNHFWGVDEEPLQYQYLMHLRSVVEQSTVCLMSHERRQTIQLIQSLAATVRYNEQQKQHNAQQEQYHQQYQQQQQQLVIDTQQQQTQQTATIYLQQASPSSQTQNATICCTIPGTGGGGGGEQQTQQQQQQQQQQTSNAATATVPQTIQIQAGPAGLIYANGVYYAPVIPTTICTCNQTWLST